MDHSSPAIREPLSHQQPSPETISQFSSTPWAASLFTDSSYTPISNVSRIPRQTTQESLISKTLQTPTTIQAWQNFYHPSSSPSTHPDEIITLVKMGTDMNGFQDIAHGGFVAVMLDEIIGMACEFRQEGRVFTMTAYLNVTYKKPVRTPGTVLLRGWVDRRQGRKIWGKGTVEDGEGNVLSQGEALFVQLKGSL